MSTGEHTSDTRRTAHKYTDNEVDRTLLSELSERILGKKPLSDADVIVVSSPLSALTVDQVSWVEHYLANLWLELDVTSFLLSNLHLDAVGANQ